MKKILIIRHAEAESPSQITDFDRKLTQNGIEKANEIGQILHQKGIIPDFVGASSALRTLETATIIATKVGFPVNDIHKDKYLYIATTKDLVSYIQNIDNQYHTAILVGHNPYISYLAEKLSKVDLGSFSPCSVACVAYENCEDWQEIGILAGKLAWFEDTKEGF